MALRMIPHQLFGYAVYSRNFFVAEKEMSLAGESAVAPSPGTACCSRDETDDNAFCAIVWELVSWAFTHVSIEKLLFFFHLWKTRMSLAVRSLHHYIQYMPTWPR